MRASASAVLAYAALLRALRPHSPPCGRGPLSKSALPSPQTPGCQTAAALRAGLACGLAPTFFITLLGEDRSGGEDRAHHGDVLRSGQQEDGDTQLQPEREHRRCSIRKPSRQPAAQAV